MAGGRSAPGVASVTLLRAARNRRAGRADVGGCRGGRRAGHGGRPRAPCGCDGVGPRRRGADRRMDRRAGRRRAGSTRRAARRWPRRTASSPRHARAVRSPGCGSRSPGSPRSRRARTPSSPPWSPRRRTRRTATSPSWSRPAGRCSASCTRPPAGWTRPSPRLPVPHCRRSAATATAPHGLRTRLAAAAATWADRPSTGAGSSRPLGATTPDYRGGRVAGSAASASVPVVPSSGRTVVPGGSPPGDWSAVRWGRGLSATAACTTTRAAGPARVRSRQQPAAVSAETGPPATTGRVRHGEGSASGTVPVPGTPSVSAASVSAASAPGTAGSPSVPGTVPAWAAAPRRRRCRPSYRVAAGGGSLIGDALLRELTEGGRTTARPVLPPSERGAVVATRDSSGRAGTVPRTPRTIRCSAP